MEQRQAEHITTALALESAQQPRAAQPAHWVDEQEVCFRWKDYRAGGRTRHKTMTLEPAEFMRRFLLQVLPSGFHRIRHYGLLANAGRRHCIERARELLAGVPRAEPQAADHDAPMKAPRPAFVCRCCGAAMTIVESFLRGHTIRAPPKATHA
jgi:putative transposase